MFKFVIVAAVITHAVEARRSQTRKDLDKKDTTPAEVALSSFMFAQHPLVSISSRGPARRSQVYAQSSQELEARLKSTKKAGKITKCMKLVAAARAQKAAKAAGETKPFIAELQKVVSNLEKQLAQEDTSDIPLLESRPVKKVALVVMTGDRGLCGGYNSKMLKKTRARIAELTALGIDVDIISIGSKGSRSFALRPGENVVSDIECGTAPTAKDAQAVVRELIDKFLEGEVDRVELIYTSFTSFVATTPSIRTMIPFSVSKDGIEMEDDEIKTITSKDGELSVETKQGESNADSLSSAAVLEQSPQDLINQILPMYLNGGLLSAWQNAVASELGSRFTAMSAATDNAKALAEELDIKINRMRQSKVTQELSEIVAGASV